MKWSSLLNFDVLGIILLICAVMYCYLTSKKRKRYKFKGLGTTDEFDFSEFRREWRSKRKSHKKKRKPKLNKHEERCREIFQKIYSRRFKSIRPKWLKNPVTGKNLELDGFCPDIRTPLGTGLAFEYDGAQHSKYNKHFHRGGPDEFVYQTKKDAWKDLRCKQEGVFLIRIPHFVAFEDLERYITDKLREKGLLPRDYSPYKTMTYSVDDYDNSQNQSSFLRGLYT